MKKFIPISIVLIVAASVFAMVFPVHIIGREDFYATAAYQDQKDEVFVFVEKRTLAWSGSLMSYLLYGFLSYGIPLSNSGDDLMIFQIKDCDIKEDAVKGISGGQETIISGELFYIASKAKPFSDERGQVEFWRWGNNQFTRMSKDFSKRMYKTELGGSDASFKPQEGWHHYKSELYNYGGASSKQSKFKIAGVCDIYIERELDLNKSYGETLSVDICGGKKRKILYQWVDKQERVSAQEYRRRTSS